MLPNWFYLKISLSLERWQCLVDIIASSNVSNRQRLFNSFITGAAVPSNGSKLKKLFALFLFAFLSERFLKKNLVASLASRGLIGSHLKAERALHRKRIPRVCIVPIQNAVFDKKSSNKKKSLIFCNSSPSIGSNTAQSLSFFYFSNRKSHDSNLSVEQAFSLIFSQKLNRYKRRSVTNQR